VPLFSNPKTGIRINNISDGLALEEWLNANGDNFVFHPGVDQIVARIKDGVVCGGVIYTGYTGRDGSIELHLCGIHPGWITRDMIWVCFDYPFNQLGVKKIWGRVKATNQVALDLDLKFGLKVETVLKDVFPDGDLNVLSMYREDCRWLALGPRPIPIL
jgi:RimJ/RimL family protein N-acetyltransferase